VIVLSLLAAVLPAIYQGQDLKSYIQLPPPGVRYRVNIASATTAPWVDSNGWRIARAPHAKFFYDATGSSPALAMAEAFAWSAEALINTAPDATAAFNTMDAFLKTIPPAPETALFNIAVTDDGSPQAAEVLNLLIRKNLLLKIVTAPDSKADLNVNANRTISNPYDFTAGVRQKLTDEKRLLRIYGGDVVLGRLTGDRNHLRVHLVNYGKNPVEGLRVRILGRYNLGRMFNFTLENPQLEDLTVDQTATEFTIPVLPVYSIVDLTLR
jgi:hypothetical protein